MDQIEAQTRIMAALMINTPLVEIAAELGVPVERVQSEIDQIQASIRSSGGSRSTEKSRRWLKFSLRGLLVLTVVVCAFLGGRVSRDELHKRLVWEAKSMRKRADALYKERDKALETAVKARCMLVAYKAGDPDPEANWQQYLSAAGY